MSIERGYTRAEQVKAAHQALTVAVEHFGAAQRAVDAAAAALSQAFANLEQVTEPTPDVRGALTRVEALLQLMRTIADVFDRGIGAPSWNRAAPTLAARVRQRERGRPRDW